MLADVGSHDLAALTIRVGENVLDEVVAELVAGYVDERHTRTIRTSLAHTVEVAVEEVGATDLETLLHDLGGELIHAVLRGEAEDVVDGASAVRKRAVLADVLDAPVAELAVSDDVDARKDLSDARTLVLLETILEDILDDETASLAQGHLVPHTAKSLVDVLHDLRW